MERKSLLGFEDCQKTENTDTHHSDLNESETIGAAFYKTDSAIKYQRAFIESNESINIDEDDANYFSKINVQKFQTVINKKTKLETIELERKADIESTGLIEEPRPKVDPIKVIKKSLKEFNIDVQKFQI